MLKELDFQGACAVLRTVLNLERGCMNLFEAVKDNVIARQAAELYGIHVRRNGMASARFIMTGIRA